METEETSGQHKGKGGHLLKDTSEHFEAKYKAAAMADRDHGATSPCHGQHTHDMELDVETQARKAFMDSMEPEAHANTILATDFDQPAAFENPELMEALRRMRISEDGSWQEVDKHTDTSSEADRGWTKVQAGIPEKSQAEGTGATGPCSPTRSPHPRRTTMAIAEAPAHPRTSIQQVHHRTSQSHLPSKG